MKIYIVYREMEKMYQAIHFFPISHSPTLVSNDASSQSLQLSRSTHKGPHTNVP